jgi:uncharacterized protein YegP (UPF0339 family)
MKTLKFYKDKKKQWRWQVIAQNGRILADSGEGYTRRSNAVKGFEAMFEITVEDIKIFADYKVEGLE